MRIAIMQPTYLPWSGYFDLMDQVDLFILLDTVQFERRSWQQRNRIRTKEGWMYLTVPVVKVGRENEIISEVYISAEHAWSDAHKKAIKFNYNRARYFQAYWGNLEQVYSTSWYRLADLNEHLIRWLAAELGVRTKIIRASELGRVPGSKVELLINICLTVGAREYLSPVGSAQYIDDERLFVDNSIKIYFQNYDPIPYNQVYPGFVSHLSALDLVMNVGGSEGLRAIRAGRGNPYTLKKIREVLMNKGSSQLGY